MVLENLRVPEADVARLAGEQIFGVFILRILDHPKTSRVEQQIFDDRPLRIFGMVRHRNRRLCLLSLRWRWWCRLWSRCLHLILLLLLLLLLSHRKRGTLLSTVLQNFGRSFPGMLLLVLHRWRVLWFTWHRF